MILSLCRVIRSRDAEVGALVQEKLRPFGDLILPELARRCLKSKQSAGDVARYQLPSWVSPGHFCKRNTLAVSYCVRDAVFSRIVR